MPPPIAAFGSADEVERFFSGATGQDFVTWFNARHAGQGSWASSGGFHAGSIETNAAAKRGFKGFCDHLAVIYGRPASLEEFVCLSSIVINETASFRPITELVGRADLGHPGISYAFDRIPELRKVSYNTSGLGRRAGELFRDSVFLGSHGHRAMASRVANTTDPRWDSDTYPQADFSTSTDPAATGIILETDFFKFRGRGLIQTTHRNNYLNLIAFIQQCDETQPVIQEYRQKWTGLDPQIVATISSNDDWDRLFQETDCLLALAAVRIHSAGAGNYLSVSPDRDSLLGEGIGSAFKVGSGVSGSTDYGRLFTRRVRQLLEGLPDPEESRGTSREEVMTSVNGIAAEFDNKPLVNGQKVEVNVRALFPSVPATAKVVVVELFRQAGIVQVHHGTGLYAGQVGWGELPYLQLRVELDASGKFTLVGSKDAMIARLGVLAFA